MPGPKFRVGDIVRVVSEPYLNCPFHWVGEMDKYCGKDFRITKVIYENAIHPNGYRISNVDNGRCIGYTWCENCFVSLAEPEPESDFSVDEDAFLNLIGL